MMDWRIIAILIQISSIYAFENHPRCGRSPTGSSQHTNGRQVTTINYPWVVAITQGDDIHCTGSIISSRFIISAAHCTRGVDTSKLEIVLGASNLKDPNNSEKGVIKRQIKSFESHNKNENGVDYDIAIIEVDEEILFVKENPRVWPICLPEKSNDNPNHLQFRGIKVLGYGPQDDEDLMLTAVDLNVKPLPICNEKYTVGQSNRNFWEILDSLPTKFDGGSVFCASNVATDDATCRGDSGGPATFFDGIKHRQLGVVHGSITSCDGSRFPSIFVRIDNPEVYDWIAKVTSSDLVKGNSGSKGNGPVTKGDCQYTCQDDKSCRSRHSSRKSGSCLPRSFGDKCFGIPENCQNCNEVVDCEAGSGPQPTPGQRAGQGQGICKYDCKSNRGCRVRFESSRRGYNGNTLGSCSSPEAGGKCFGIPTYCTECSFKCQGKAGSKFEEGV